MNDLVAFGAPPEVIEQMKASRDEPDAFEVFEENWISLSIFLRMDTQWRVGFSGPTGLDYNVLPILFRLFKVDDKLKVFEHIRLMEREALFILSKKKGSSNG